MFKRQLGFQNGVDQIRISLLCFVMKDIKTFYQNPPGQSVLANRHRLKQNAQLMAITKDQPVHKSENLYTVSIMTSIVVLQI